MGLRERIQGNNGRGKTEEERGREDTRGALARRVMRRNERETPLPHLATLLNVDDPARPSTPPIRFTSTGNALPSSAHRLATGIHSDAKLERRPITATAAVIRSGRTIARGDAVSPHHSRAGGTGADSGSDAVRARGAKSLVHRHRPGQYAQRPLVRASAAAGLGYLGDARALPELRLALLEDHHWSTRISAAVALGMLRDQRAVDVLMDGLRGAFTRSAAEKEALQRACIGSLGELGATAAMPQLLPFAQARDFLTRQVLAEALGALMPSCNTPDTAAYRQAAEKCLQHLAQDAHTNVRDAA
eukprot:ctg_2440.g378